ncbi:hypothetical protein [Mycobacterium sp. RTGN5]|uniref:hypothetical protein n=1 Tax=Mycobacterium sp. RTGN5 TaxID=3016522 RepID=UPI0029C943C3|nr:hypothetical protein [Mycobacterium sp. RTGN5]
MIKNRIATTAALAAFGLASFGGIVVAIAAPANADTGTTTTVEGTAMTGTAGEAVGDAREVTEELEGATRGSDVTSVPTPGSAATGVHIAFPMAPASPHDGQGHKGANNLPHSLGH